MPLPAELGADFEADTDVWAIVNQAAGMVSVQLDIPVGDALVRLRAHSFRSDRPASEVGRRCRRPLGLPAPSAGPTDFQ